jgi:hypothetical protein
MALDFTVVITVRQRFGDNDIEDVGLETEAPFVGSQKDFEFHCPNVDSRQQAVLLFQCMGTNAQQSMEINGQQIFGGIPAAFDFLTTPTQEIRTRAEWNGNVMLIQPGVLRENNVLRIRAGELSNGNLDDFIIDNLVVMFKTRPGLNIGAQPAGNLSPR